MIWFFTIALTVYFLLFRARIDVFLVAYGSTVIYFLPCFFGYDLYGVKLNFGINLTFFSVIVAIFIASKIYDINYGRQQFSALRSDGAYFLSNTSTIILALHMLYLIVAYGPSQIFVPKREAVVSFFDIFFLRTISTISFISSLAIMRKWNIFVSVTALVLLLLSGDRTGIVMAVLAAVLLVFQGQRVGVHSILRLSFGLALLVVFGVYGKAIYFYASRVMAGHSLQFFEVLSDFSRLERFEPFATQAIFNKILHSGFTIDSSYLLSLPVILLPSSRVFGVSSAHFNTEFQSALFHANTPGSMAYNFWAEGYANFQESGVLLFIIIYVSVLFAFQVGLSKSRSIWIHFSILIMSPYWAFYIHRNSLFSILSYEKQFFYLIFLFYLLYRFRNYLASR